MLDTSKDAVDEKTINIDEMKEMYVPLTFGHDVADEQENEFSHVDTMFMF